MCFVYSYGVSLPSQVLNSMSGLGAENVLQPFVGANDVLCVIYPLPTILLPQVLFPSLAESVLSGFAKAFIVCKLILIWSKR